MAMQKDIPINSLNLFDINKKTHFHEVNPSLTLTKSKLVQGAAALTALKGAALNGADSEVAYYIDILNSANKTKLKKDFERMHPRDLLEYADMILTQVHEFYNQKDYDPKIVARCEQLSIIYEVLTEKAQKSAMDLYVTLQAKDGESLKKFMNIIFKTFELSIKPMPKFHLAAVDNLSRTLNIMPLKLLTCLEKNLKQNENNFGNISNIELFNTIGQFSGLIDLALENKKNLETFKLYPEQKTQAEKIYAFIPGSIHIMFEELHRRVKTDAHSLYKELIQKDKLDDLFGILIRDDIKRHDIIQDLMINVKLALNDRLAKSTEPINAKRKELTNMQLQIENILAEIDPLLKQKENYIKQKTGAGEDKAKELDKEIAIVNEHISVVEEKAGKARNKTNEADKTIEYIKSENQSLWNIMGKEYGELVGSCYKAVFDKYNQKSAIELAWDAIRSVGSAKIEASVGAGTPTKTTVPFLPILPAPGAGTPGAGTPGVGTPGAGTPGAGSYADPSRSSSAAAASQPQYKLEASFSIDIFQVSKEIDSKITDNNIKELAKKLNVSTPEVGLSITPDNKSAFSDGYYDGLSAASGKIKQSSPNIKTQ